MAKLDARSAAERKTRFNLEHAWVFDKDSVKEFELMEAGIRSVEVERMAMSGTWAVYLKLPGNVGLSNTGWVDADEIQEAFDKVIKNWLKTSPHAPSAASVGADGSAPGGSASAAPMPFLKKTAVIKDKTSNAADPTPTAEKKGPNSNSAWRTARRKRSRSARSRSKASDKAEEMKDSSDSDTDRLQIDEDEKSGKSGTGGGTERKTKGGRRSLIMGRDFRLSSKELGEKLKRLCRRGLEPEEIDPDSYPRDELRAYLIEAERDWEPKEAKELYQLLLKTRQRLELEIPKDLALPAVAMWRKAGRYGLDALCLSKSDEARYLLQDLYLAVCSVEVAFKNNEIMGMPGFAGVQEEAAKKLTKLPKEKPAGKLTDLKKADRAAYDRYQTAKKEAAEEWEASRKRRLGPLITLALKNLDFYDGIERVRDAKDPEAAERLVQEMAVRFLQPFYEASEHIPVFEGAQKVYEASSKAVLTRLRRLK